MKTVHKIEFTTYTVDDHPHPERCIEYVCENWHDLYTDQEENANSLRGFCEYNSFTMVDYSVSLCGHSFAIANVPEDLEDLRGVLLYEYMLGAATVPEEDCPFTGLCMDEVLLQPMREFVAKPQLMETTYQELVNECLAAWVATYIECWEATYSDENIREHLLINEYEFTEDGKFYE